MKFTITGFFLLALLGISGCSLPTLDLTPNYTPPTLPAATTTGANTFGFLLNDQVWLPDGGFSDFPARSSEYSGVGGFGINAENLKSGISISVRPSVLVNHQYDLRDSVNTFFIFFDTSACYFGAKNIISGSLTITRLDSVNRIYSGQFELKLLNSSCSKDTVKITSGRFDLAD